MTAQVRRARRVNPVRLTEAAVLRRAVCPCEILPAGLPGLATINGKDYRLSYNATLPERGGPAVHGYQLAGIDSLNVYDIDAALTSCDCPDMTFSRGTADHPCCKHVAALRLFRERGEVA